MSLEKSQKIIKVFGILSIISAILALLGGIAMLGIGGIGAAAAGETVDQELAMGIGVALIAGIAALLTGVVDLVEGIFCMRAAKDAGKAQPLWIVSIIAVIFAAITLITSFQNGTQEILSAVFALAVNCFVLYLANNIKKHA
jgi:hypothetical protein